MFNSLIYMMQYHLVVLYQYRSSYIVYANDSSIVLVIDLHTGIQKQSYTLYTDLWYVTTCYGL